MAKKRKKLDFSVQVASRISVHICNRQTCLSCMWSQRDFNQSVQH